MSGHMVLSVWNEVAEEHDGGLYPHSYCDGSCPAYESTGELECGDQCKREAFIDDVWFAEYTAPGYMDRTDPIASTIGPIDAARECFAQYGDDTDPDERRELANVIRELRRLGHRS